MGVKRKYGLVDWIGKQKNRWLLHFIFWVAVLFFYTIFFGYQSMSYRITFSFVTVLLPVTIATTYFLNYELIPNFLLKKKYAYFFLYFIYTLIVSFYINLMTVMGIFIAVAEMNYEELYPSNTKALILVAGMYVVVFLGVAIKLVNQFQSNQIEIQKLKSEKIEAELKFLKAQLHPHFLFNTLNNLYSLTLEKSEKAPDVVLKLSGLLDYILYECNAEFVPVEDEIHQMKNYIELEKLRYGDRLSIEFNSDSVPQKAAIPPMLFMTLLENSFKHGVSKTTENSWIRLSFSLVNEYLIFVVENSKPIGSNAEKDFVGGIGLENLKNRLNLIYKDDYKLIMHEGDISFRANLKLKIKAVR